MLQKCTVLYVEDDSSVRASVSELLGRYFGTVLEASDGEEALRLFYHYKPDALFTDIDMPNMDGLSLAEEIRKENEMIPIVILTAYTDTPKLIKAAELLLIKYLLKPVDPTLFRESLSKIAKRIMQNREISTHLSDNFIWYRDSLVLMCDSRVIPLTDKERRLLELLVDHMGSGVSYAEIMAVLWSDDYFTETSIDAVKFHVSSLRRKLPKGVLKNIYAKGYRLSSNLSSNR